MAANTHAWKYCSCVLLQRPSFLGERNGTPPWHRRGPWTRTSPRIPRAILGGAQRVCGYATCRWVAPALSRIRTGTSTSTSPTPCHVNYLEKDECYSSCYHEMERITKRRPGPAPRGTAYRGTVSSPGVATRRCPSFCLRE